MHYKEPKNRYQLMMSICLDDFIPPNNPVRIIDAFIENIVDNNPEKFRYKGQNNIGQKAYSPKTFLKLYMYGYSNSITSSRKLEIEAQRNIEVKWLLGDLQPDFKTIADYRKDNREQVKLVAREIRKFLKDQEMIDGELVAIDGTKVKANANRNILNVKKIKNRLKEIDQQIDKYLEEIKIQDIEEEIIEEENIDEPSQINKQAIKRIAKLQEEIEELKEAQAKLESSERNHISLTDKDAALMKMRGGSTPGYNIQAAVDSKNMMIMGNYATDTHVDYEETNKMIKKLKQEYSKGPSKLTLDKGYYKLDNLANAALKDDVECFLPVPDSKYDDEEITFEYDEEEDRYICSEGEPLELVSKNVKKRGTLADRYRGTNCNECSRKSACTKSKKGRMKYRYKNQEWRDKFKEKMKTAEAKEIIEKRKGIVEHVFGTIKYWMGKIPIKLRGIKKVETEISLYSTAYNIKRMMNIDSYQSIMKSINEYEWKVV